MPLDPALVGHETPRQTYTITPEDIHQFASAIGDPNQRYQQAGQQRMIAPPTFVTRFRVPFADVGLDPAHSQVLHLEQVYEYARPVGAGDVVVGWHRLATLRQSSRGSIITLETIGQGPDGASIFMGTATVMVREGNPEAGGSGRAAKQPAIPEGEPVTPLSKHVTQAQIDAYADASGDHNPIHINPEAARAVGLDGTIAHGMLSMAFLGQVATDWLATHGHPGGWLTRLRVRFQAMVRPEDTLSCQGVLVAGSEAGRQSIEVWADNQRGERVTTGEAEVALEPA
jgi:acyl dehydratase